MTKPKIYQYISSHDYPNAPDFSKFGLLPIEVSGVCRTQTECAALVQKAVASECPLILDIEDLPVDIRKHSVPEVASSIATILQRIKWCRDAAGSQKLEIGVYGADMIREYWVPVNNKPDEMSAWRLACQKLKPIADACDYVVASAYMFFKPDDPSHPVSAEKYIRGMYEMAAVLGKRVMLFFWPMFHPDGPPRPIDGTYQSAAFMRAQIELALHLGADVVIWLAGKHPQLEWSAMNTWWTALQDVLGELQA